MSQNRQDAIVALFRERYGSDPAWWVRAPGRVDLMGSHTDYNLGYVMTMSIDRDTWMTADEAREYGLLDEIVDSFQAIS